MPTREILEKVGFMKTFKIFVHPDGGRQAVKVGFSWPAFFFGILLSFFGAILWMLSKGLWRFAGLWSVILVIVVFVENAIRTSALDPAMKSVLEYVLFGCYLAAMLIPAMKGNDWRVRKLLSRRYAVLTTVAASSPAQALERLKQDEARRN